MKEDYKLLLKLPEQIHFILQNYKKKTGMSMTSYIQRALYRQLINDRLLYIKMVTLNVDPENGEMLDSVPESIKYCDGDKCQVM